MASGVTQERGVRPASPSETSLPKGLLLTESPALARAFRRELHACDGCVDAFEVRESMLAALEDVAPYRWVAVDLDAAVAPSDSLRLARATWPDARIAVLSCWWSERDALARNMADAVLHKPVRSAELLGFLGEARGRPAQTPASRAG